MKILALELSSGRGSVAWRDGDTDLARDWPNDRKNSAEFFQNLSSVRQEFGLPDTIIVGLGPGSYAGTRIAISAAIGLAFGGGTIALIGYPSICAYETSENEYCVIGDARRNSFFFARIVGRNLAEGPDLFAEPELERKLFNLKIPIFASEALPQFHNVNRDFPSASVLAKLAGDANRIFVLPPLEPIYLREPHITVARSK